MRRALFGPGPHDTVKSITDDGERRMRAIGVVSGAYFLTPAFHSQISTRTAVVTYGIPPEAVRVLSDPDILANDPFPDHVMAAGRPMTWQQVLADIDLTEGQRDYVDLLEKYGMVDAISVPLFGPNGRNSYSVFGLGRQIIDVDQALVTRIVEIAQVVHLKVCMIVDRDRRGPVAMSKREAEVLHWMAHGKSNADIATILGVSPGTIDTFVRRIYSKLHVNDRISAVLTGISRGVVNL